MSEEQKRECVRKNKEFLERYKKCRNCYLVGADFKNADLKNVDLYGSDLSDANLEDTDLHGAILTCAKFNNAHFNEFTNLKEARLEETESENCSSIIVKAASTCTNPFKFSPSDQNDERIKKLKIDLHNKRKKLFSAIPDKSITKLYKLYGRMSLYMSEKEIVTFGR
jgi:hypothetical protein